MKTEYMIMDSKVFRLLLCGLGLLFVSIIGSQSVLASVSFKGDGPIMQIDYNSGEIVIQEEFFYLKKGDGDTWATEIIDVKGQSLLLEVFGESDLVYIDADILGNGKRVIRQLKMLEDRTLLNEKTEISPKVKKNSEMHLENGVWKNS